MIYASKAAMVARFGNREITELTDRADPPANIIDDDNLGIGMSDADAMISQALLTAGLTVVPTAVAPAVLVSIACDIARFRLSNLPIVPRGETHPVERRYNLAVAQLTAIAEGRMDVPGTILIAADDIATGIAIGTKRATFGSEFDAAFRTDVR